MKLGYINLPSSQGYVMGARRNLFGICVRTLKSMLGEFGTKRERFEGRYVSGRSLKTTKRGRRESKRRADLLDTVHPPPNPKPGGALILQL